MRYINDARYGPDESRPTDVERNANPGNYPTTTTTCSFGTSKSLKTLSPSELQLGSGDNDGEHTSGVRAIRFVWGKVYGLLVYKPLH